MNAFPCFALNILSFFAKIISDLASAPVTSYSGDLTPAELSFASDMNAAISRHPIYNSSDAIQSSGIWF